ncbi:MAG TPA: DUF1552 domain-containing protein [Pirellulales bacterium]|jgi:hypothetical protein|nr:DUF1552 domain-containing protein [Pirellulales bacterium]
MSRTTRISRRTVLRGLGSVIALPALEAMLPRKAIAAASSAIGPKPPTRMLWVYTPNGQHMPDWVPHGVGTDFELPRTLELLKDFRRDILVLSGLAQDNAFAHGDGGGDHARALATFLTGCHVRKTSGSDIKVGVSADQVAAAQLGHLTRFPSLEVGCEHGGQAGNCDSGYSCAYSSNIAWRGEATPVAKEVNPQSVFDRLFSGGDPAERERRKASQKSVLDFVRDDASRLQNQLGQNDRRKMDEYLSSVRELEQRLARPGDDSIPKPAMNRPSGIPKDFGEHIRLMYDLLAVAFQTDSTRIASFVVANEGSNRSYPMIGVNDGHHEVSHHAGDKKKQEKIAKINRFHMEQFARFLGKLRSIKEGEETLLDHSMIVYGSCIADGNSHAHDNLPIVLAGHGSGSLSPGRHLDYPRKTPLNDLWLALLDRINVKVDHLGDSDGRLPQLSG